MHAVLNKMARGITVCYAEAFPNQTNDYFHLVYFGKLFLVADSYCMNPDCECQEAVLNFVQAYPREDKKRNNFMIRIKLNGRGFKIHDQGRFSKRDIQAVVNHFTNDEMILKLLNERYKKMKEKGTEMLS